MCNNSHTGRKEAKSEAGEELAYIVHICSHQLEDCNSATCIHPPLFEHLYISYLLSVKYFSGDTWEL
jgi:hypothetical protein